MLRHTFFYCLLPLLFCACKKEDSNEVTVPPDPPVVVEPPIIALGKASVLRNGKFEEPLLKATYFTQNALNTFDLKAIKYLSGGLTKEQFSIFDVPLKKGKHLIDYHSLFVLRDAVPQSGISWVVDGDQGAGTQLVDTTRSPQHHFIEVIRYDSIKHTVEGRFQVFLKNYKSAPILPGVPDTISFTQGKFHLYISN